MQVYHTGIVHCFHDSVSVVHALVFLLFRLYVTAVAPLDPGMFVLLTLCLIALPFILWLLFSNKQWNFGTS